MSDQRLVTVDYLNSVVALRAVYRDVLLGSSFTSAQLNAIRAGDFSNLPIGSYWLHNGIHWRIVDINYYIGTGGSGGMSAPHLVVVADEPFAAQAMATSSRYGYAWSAMELGTEGAGLASARLAAQNFFGAGALKTHRQLFSNSEHNGKVSSTIWVDSTGSLMSEVNVFGSRLTSALTYALGMSTIDTQQFAAFRLDPSLITRPRVNWWLRDVMDTDRFATVGQYGNAEPRYCTSYAYLRPYFLIG